MGDSNVVLGDLSLVSINHAIWSVSPNPNELINLWLYANWLKSSAKVLKLIPNCGNEETETDGVILGVGVFVGVACGVDVFVGVIGILVSVGVVVGVACGVDVFVGVIGILVSVGVGVGVVGILVYVGVGGGGTEGQLLKPPLCRNPPMTYQVL